MPRNTLDDLNNHLFEQMERLNDDSLCGEELQQEIYRGKAMGNIATKIIEISQVELHAAKVKAEYGRDVATPLMIEGSGNGKKTTN